MRSLCSRSSPAPTANPARTLREIDSSADMKQDVDAIKELEEGTQSSRDIWVIPSVGVEPVFFLGTEFDERHPRFSPDGDWIAFTSDRSGQDEVYVKSFPGPSGFRKCCMRRTPTQDGELP